MVDTWWQTETGMHMISPMPGVTEGKPVQRCGPFPASTVDVVNDEAEPVPNGSGGYLVITKPWPAMLRTIWGDDQRYIDTYWSRFEGCYFAGDGAKKDEDGDLWLLGRVDDVMNVSGHRMSTTEIESALVSHPKVAEAAVVGATDETTGQAIVAFVILRADAGDGWRPDVVAGAPHPCGQGDRLDRASRGRSWSSRSCRRPDRARSCAGCCATSPRTASSATSPR